MDIGYKMSMALGTRKSTFGSNYWLWFHILFINTLLQNATDIINSYMKCNSCFVTKCDIGLLQNATVLLQNVTVITKCNDYYETRRYTRIPSFFSKLWVYDKMQ